MASPRHLPRHILQAGVVSAILCGVVMAQAKDANYDEARVPAYVLPDPLTLLGGGSVKDADTWRTKRRPEVLRLFEDNVYGRSPGRPDGVRTEAPEVDARAL